MKLLKVVHNNDTKIFTKYSVSHQTVTLTVINVFLLSCASSCQQIIHISRNLKSRPGHLLKTKRVKEIDTL